MKIRTEEWRAGQPSGMCASSGFPLVKSFMKPRARQFHTSILNTPRLLMLADRNQIARCTLFSNNDKSASS